VPISEVALVNPRLPKDVDPAQKVSFLAMASVSENGELLDQESRVLNDTKKGFTYFERGDVILAKITPCFENGKAAFLDGLETQIGFGSTEFHVLRPDSARLDAKYLFYLVWSDHFRFHGQNSMQGAAGQKRVSATYLKDFVIPLPPLSEQKRIATILDKADALRRKRQQAIELADQFLRSVFLDMFGDPVSNPKGWSEAPLATGIACIESGWSAKGDNRPASEGQIGVLKISSVTSGKFIPSENKVVDESTVPTGKKLLKPCAGDLLFSRANTRDLVAATAIVDKDYDNLFLPDKLWKIQTNELLLPEFLNYLLWHQRMRDRLRSQATGTSGSMLNISKKKFEETSAIFPPIEKQLKFVEMYRKARAISEKYSSSSDLTEELFASASQKAFSSQL
jgi:type I restriction enzyme S subunit